MALGNMRPLAKKFVPPKLMITSMMDMFTIILIFLLFQFSEKPEMIQMQKDIELPIAQLGSTEFLEAMLKKICAREGFGNVLAEGAIRASEIVGKESREIEDTRAFFVDRLVVGTQRYVREAPDRPGVPGHADLVAIEVREGELDAAKVTELEAGEVPGQLPKTLLDVLGEFQPILAVEPPKLLLVQLPFGFRLGTRAAEALSPFYRFVQPVFKVHRRSNDVLNRST